MTAVSLYYTKLFKCQFEEFADRKVTRANPASPEASRTELP